jgi:bifunctional UDP-N-acetylglucosamine pyrophosphorylase/glucosamine-1-phosphate N-acetyltransferase
VAPVNVASYSFVGAGSVITKDVPEAALAVARSKQVNLLNKAKLKAVKSDE